MSPFEIPVAELAREIEEYEKYKADPEGHVKQIAEELARDVEDYRTGGVDSYLMEFVFDESHHEVLHELFVERALNLAAQPALRDGILRLPNSTRGLVRRYTYYPDDESKIYTITYTGVELSTKMNEIANLLPEETTEALGRLAIMV
jgi:hypothetical protein